MPFIEAKGGYGLTIMLPHIVIGNSNSFPNMQLKSCPRKAAFNFCPFLGAALW
jgi:hypothetical protein